jgi:hypothetical protein
MARNIRRKYRVLKVLQINNQERRGELAPHTPFSTARLTVEVRGIMETFPRSFELSQFAEFCAHIPRKDHFTRGGTQ